VVCRQPNAPAAFTPEGIWETHTTGPNFTLPNTDYSHKTSQVISVKHVLIIPEDGS